MLERAMTSLDNPSDTASAAPIAEPTGFSHIRLTVTDIATSKAFYTALFGAEPTADFSDSADEPGVREDPERLYGGCTFAVGANQILGLRPVAVAGDRFDSTRVGLDHLSLAVGSTDDLDAAIQRLNSAGVSHGEVTPLQDFAMAILSIQDPDDINLELSAPLS